MKRVVVSAAAVVFAFMLFSGVGNSVASASENAGYRNPYTWRMTKTSEGKVTKFRNPYAGRETRTSVGKVTNFRNPYAWRLKCSNKAIAGRDVPAEAAGR